MLQRVSEIPEGWERITVVNTLENFQNGFAFDAKTYSLDGIPIIRMSNISLDGKFIFDEKEAKFCTEEEYNKLSTFHVSYGDLIIAMTDVTPQKALIGRTAIVNINKKFIFNQRVGLLKIKNNKYSSRFLHYYFNFDYFRNYAKSFSGMSAQANLSTNDIKKAPILIPKLLQEQFKIADILSTVDEAIDKTETLIQKYQRIKQGLMQDLLTKGINEKGNIRDEKTHKFKDSPLGRIPEEWEVKKTGDFIKVKGGFAFKSGDFVEDGVPLIRISNIQNGYLDYSELVFLPQKFLNFLSEFLLQEGNLIIAMTGAMIGKPAIVRKNDLPAFLNQRVGKYVIVLGDLIDFNYFKQIVFSDKYRNIVIDLGMGISDKFPNVSSTQLENILIPYPLVKEQTQIASILSDVDEKIYEEQTYKQKLLSIKRGSMEDLLTGTVRVNHLIGKN